RGVGCRSKNGPAIDEQICLRVLDSLLLGAGQRMPADKANSYWQNRLDGLDYLLLRTSCVRKDRSALAVRRCLLHLRCDAIDRGAKDDHMSVAHGAGKIERAVVDGA